MEKENKEKTISKLKAKLKIVNIGNSKGCIIPKTLMDFLDIQDNSITLELPLKKEK